MRRQLVVVFAAVASLVALSFVVPLALLVGRTAEDRALDGARSDAAAVTPVAAVARTRQELEAAVSVTGAGSRGEMTVVTPSWSVGPAVASPRLDAALSTGASDIGPVAGGAEVVVAVATGAGETSAIRVFVPAERLRAGRTRAWGALGLVALALTVIAVVVADRLSRRVVQPVTTLAAAARRLGDGDLDTRVSPDGPVELVELGAVFNQLGSRVASMLVNERELVAELSHRLRTPLTKLRLRLDLVDDADLAAQLGADLDDVVAVVSDLITQARSTTGAQQGCDAVAVVAERAGFWSVLAEDQGRPWRLATPPGPVPVGVAADDLAAAVDTLIENVFSHTDEGVAAAVTVAVAADEVRITVEDGGPGFAAEAAVRGRSGAGSTGLGLDIARRTAAGAGAGGSFTIGVSRLGGAAVELRLPRTEPPPR